MFSKVLIANRGEIAARVTLSLRRLGVRAVAVYAPDDSGAPHVTEADEAVMIPSYLDGAAIIEACLWTGAQAVHPGYGFLSENADFARACDAAGIVFIGPPASAIDAMGDKIRAKLTVAAAGVPVVPGRDEHGLSDAQLAAAALEVGLPVLVKPSAGGGGKGMRLVREYTALAEAIASARREAATSFGDDTLLVERFVENPRHIEIQVFADRHGNTVHLGERECSLQRRHQKIIEEAPSPLLTPEQRERMGASAVAAARAVGYVGAGTVEYIVPADKPDEYYFMEMNTRLQVEHPVTEEVVGRDLVALQVRVAAGQPLGFTQDQVVLTGHAVEARVYAEDPARGFLPTGGRILDFQAPLERVDAGVVTGSVVGSRYDPMIAKVIAKGETRDAALRALDLALDGFVLLGVTTNVPFLRALITHPAVLAGELDTGLVERELAGLVEPVDETPALVAAAVLRLRALRTGNGPWEIPDGWRLGAAAWTSWLLTAGGEPHEVAVRGRPEAAEVAIDGAVHTVSVRDCGYHQVRAVIDGYGRTYAVAWDGQALWLGRGGASWAIRAVERSLSGGASAAAGGVLRSPMPGTVLAVKVAEGDTVTEGQPVVIVEAMKMEHTVTAAIAGTVTRLAVRTGAQVALDAVLAEITPEGGV